MKNHCPSFFSLKLLNKITTYTLFKTLKNTKNYKIMKNDCPSFFSLKLLKKITTYTLFKTLKSTKNYKIMKNDCLNFLIKLLHPLKYDCLYLILSTKYFYMHLTNTLLFKIKLTS